MILPHMLQDYYQWLTDAKEMIQQNLKEAQYKPKLWYNKRAHEEHFEHGDKVLVLLPTQRIISTLYYTNIASHFFISFTGDKK